MLGRSGWIWNLVFAFCFKLTADCLLLMAAHKKETDSVSVGLFFVRSVTLDHAISIAFDMVAFTFGSVSVSTPFSNPALIFSASTSDGSVNDRVKRP